MDAVSLVFFQVELEDGSKLPAYTYFLIKPLEEDRRPSKVRKHIHTTLPRIAGQLVM